ncbi:hypothetical protein BGZ76_004965, partial [Entomortierella beljakovae]
FCDSSKTPETQKRKFNGNIRGAKKSRSNDAGDGQHSTSTAQTISHNTCQKDAPSIVIDSTRDENEDSDKEELPQSPLQPLSTPSLRISFQEFLLRCPDDIGPTSFFNAFAIDSPYGESVWKSAYVSLYFQALKSQDTDIYEAGLKMKEKWESSRSLVESYWRVLPRPQATSCPVPTTRQLLGPDLPSQSSGSDFVCSESDRGRLSINSIDIKFINRLVGPGVTSSKLSGKSLHLVGNENVSARLMLARRSNVIRQSQLESTSDILSLNFIFTEEFLDEYLTDDMKADFKNTSVSESDEEEMTTLGKAAMTRDCFPTPSGYEEKYEPDFMGERDGYPFILMEVKKPDAYQDTLEYDAQKLPQMMKLALNQMVSSGIKSPRVVGLLVHGSFGVPEDHKQLGLFLASIGPLKCAKDIVASTLRAIIARPRGSQSPLHHWTRPSFYLKGIKVPAALPPSIDL